MRRKQIQFETKTVRLSDIKFTEGALVCHRKVERMKEQYLGMLPDSTETEQDWMANTAFLAALIVALTNLTRLAAHEQDPTLKTAVAPQGAVELIHYAAENLAFRLVNPRSPKTWSLDDVLADLVEAAEFYGLQDFLDNALMRAGR